MNTKETLKIIAYIKDNYPSAWGNTTAEDIKRITKTWNMSLKDYSYDEIFVATKAFVETDQKGYAPSIGQILGKLRAMTKPKQLDEFEIRSIIYRATQNGIYGAEDEYNKMPKEVQRIVGSPNRIRAISLQDEDQAEITINAMLKSYRYVREEEEEFDEIPYSTRLSLKEIIQLASEHKEEE